MRILIRILKSMLWTLLIAVIVVVLLLLFFQGKIIYHPHPYANDPAHRRGVLALQYQTAQGRQQAYYLGPRDGRLPHRLWVAFPGNGSLALDWLHLINPPENPDNGFLLIDYPGYGACEGKPSPKSIEESSEAAYGALAASLKTDPAALDKNVDILCQSLGCATGLNFAMDHPVKHVVLISPFTSMREMARRTVGWPLCYILLHNYDNRARLGDLASRADPPRVTILHGDADTFVPFAMGQELARMFPSMIAFEPIPGAGHNSIITMGWDKILAAIRTAQD
jgi:uncharacterized protein